MLIDMMSTFIFRRESGNNQSVTRATIAAMDFPAEAVLPESASELGQLSKQFRSGAWVEHFGIKQNSKHVIFEATFTPCPNNDFNGANFLYFASFQAFVDRAEWQWFQFEKLPTLSNRDLFFYGNINVGDSLSVRLCAHIAHPESITHWCEIIGMNDVKIADIFTHKLFK